MDCDQTPFEQAKSLQLVSHGGLISEKERKINEIILSPIVRLVKWFLRHPKMKFQAVGEKWELP